MDLLRRAWEWWFGDRAGMTDRLVGRWLFLRALGLVYASAFFALLFQARGLVGSRGIEPAAEYLKNLGRLGVLRFWAAPSLMWLHPSDGMLMGLCWAGLLASILVVLNLVPRWALVVCWICFLSFVGVSQEFGEYQSDGMLLEAGLLSILLAPRGMRPGWGKAAPPQRAVVMLLLWEWFRIYFQSGAVKLLSGDPTWRNLTAMYEYYQNGPLPTWVGWYLQHLPHWFHIATAAVTLGMELLLVWMALLPRSFRVACLVIVTVWQLGVIATANYAFLNYLVLVLGFLLLDDVTVRGWIPARWTRKLDIRAEEDEPAKEADAVMPVLWRRVAHAASAVLLIWLGYATLTRVVTMFRPGTPLPMLPVELLEPFRVDDSYGLFATMTPHRYEIEFQGSNDGVSWQTYQFRYKPQDIRERPRIYAPYQPRFDWNLWFASLEGWRQSPMVPLTEERLLEGSHDVLGLFASDPFRGRPPRYVRAVLWQYWFSSSDEKRRSGAWWRRRLLGTFSPTMERNADGQFAIVESPTLDGPPER